MGWEQVRVFPLNQNTLTPVPTRKLNSGGYRRLAFPEERNHQALFLIEYT
jgi:hypothetical protein